MCSKYFLFFNFIVFVYAENQCYNNEGKAQRCIPSFINCALGLEAEVTNICGVAGPQNYCALSLVDDQHCQICDSRVERFSHPSKYLTDQETFEHPSWWQSETLFENVDQNPVNITLDLGKTFIVLYVRLYFQSPRPESMAIYRKISDESGWLPWQYYSVNCQATFNLSTSEAQCSQDFSNISPLSGGVVDLSPGKLYANQTWLQLEASEIRIELKRLNTFGDEVFKEEKVLKSYYYAISNLEIGGRCQCNGHANDCPKVDGQYTCLCEHNTTGQDCQQCIPFYNDKPWRPNVPCEECNCNGLSNECYFDEELFHITGHGGHCIECAGNGTGPGCQYCSDGFYRPFNSSQCLSCDCEPLGSLIDQCDSNTGQCQCKPGVTGRRCDRCIEGLCCVCDSCPATKQTQEKQPMPKVSAAIIEVPEGGDDNDTELFNTLI